MAKELGQDALYQVIARVAHDEACTRGVPHDAVLEPAQ